MTRLAGRSRGRSFPLLRLGRAVARSRRVAKRDRTLVIDIGGSHVKAIVEGQSRPVKFVSGPDLTPRRMVRDLTARTRYWRYDRVAIGYPGPVAHNRPVADPHNLGRGWAGFDFHRAFRRPVRLINDAAMQAIGSYEGGRMLFLGLGTGLGAAMIVDGRVEPMEIGHLPYRKGRSFEDYLGERGLERLGKKRWRKHVELVVEQFRAALEPAYIVLGGGNVRLLRHLPPGARRGDNRNAFLGGKRLWEASGTSPLVLSPSLVGPGHPEGGRRLVTRATLPSAASVERSRPRGRGSGRGR